jgi:hypothetical protein
VNLNQTIQVRVRVRANMMMIVRGTSMTVRMTRNPSVQIQINHSCVCMIHFVLAHVSNEAK